MDHPFFLDSIQYFIESTYGKKEIHTTIIPSVFNILLFSSLRGVENGLAMCNASYTEHSGPQIPTILPKRLNWKGGYLSKEIGSMLEKLENPLQRPKNETHADTAKTKLVCGPAPLPNK